MKTPQQYASEATELAWKTYEPGYKDAAMRELASLLQARDERDELKKFKAFVHSYLSSHGVPEGDPANQHQIEGCRIGARLDLLLTQRDNLKSELETARAESGELKQAIQIERTENACYRSVFDSPEKAKSVASAAITVCENFHKRKTVPETELITALRDAGIKIE